MVIFLRLLAIHCKMQTAVDYVEMSGKEAQILLATGSILSFGNRAGALSHRSLPTSFRPEHLRPERIGEAQNRLIQARFSLSRSESVLLSLSAGLPRLEPKPRHAQYRRRAENGESTCESAGRRGRIRAVGDKLAEFSLLAAAIEQTKPLMPSAYKGTFPSIVASIRQVSTASERASLICVCRSSFDKSLFYIKQLGVVGPPGD